MAAIDESPVGSPLSELSSDDFAGEEEQDRLASEAAMPPAKRQKLGNSSTRATPSHVEEDFGYISEDTDGDVPTSPNNLRPEDDDTHEQVTVCAWEGCDAGDLGDMDELVKHIHSEHIEASKHKKYSCEWSDCTRKGIDQASGYALKAHMRSHTREKPFYCTLPECDRSFTRSDALAKHMRTVHETEALRPSDPIPKSMQPMIKSRLKLSMKPQQPHDGAPHPLNDITNGDNSPGWSSSFPIELGFTAEEEGRGSEQLYRLLRRQVHWAEEEGKALEKQCEEMEKVRKQEWLDKEVLFDESLNQELGWQRRREEILRQMDNSHLQRYPVSEETPNIAAVPSPLPSDAVSPQKPAEEATPVLAPMQEV